MPENALKSITPLDRVCPLRSASEAQLNAKQQSIAAPKNGDK
jgi:hypothetical protein